MSVTLACSLAVEDGHLVLDYTVTNSGLSEVGLFNRVPGGTIRRDYFAADRLVVDWDAGRLSLRKRVEPVPPPLQVVMEPLPYLTRLPGGERFRETVRLSLPVRAYNLYRRALVGMTLGVTAEATRPVTANVVAFSLGYFVNDGRVEFIPAGDEFPSVWRVAPIGPAVECQQLLEHVHEFAAPVPVLDYPAAAVRG